jgi:hypothetical protein
MLGFRAFIECFLLRLTNVGEFGENALSTGADVGAGVSDAGRTPNGRKIWEFVSRVYSYRVRML